MRGSPLFRETGVQAATPALHAAQLRLKPALSRSTLFRSRCSVGILQTMNVPPPDNRPEPQARPMHETRPDPRNMSWSYGVWLWTLMGALAPTKVDKHGDHATGTAHREVPGSPFFENAHAGPPSLESDLTAARAEEVGGPTASRIGAHLFDLPAQSDNSSIASAKFYGDTFKKGSGTLIDTLRPTTSQLQEDVLRRPSSIAPGAPAGTSGGGTSETANLPATALGFTPT